MLSVAGKVFVAILLVPHQSADLGILTIIKLFAFSMFELASSLRWASGEVFLKLGRNKQLCSKR